MSIIKQLQDIAKFTEKKYPNEEYKNGTFNDKLWMNLYLSYNVLSSSLGIGIANESCKCRYRF